MIPFIIDGYTLTAAYIKPFGFVTALNTFFCCTVQGRQNSGITFDNVNDITMFVMNVHYLQE